MPDIRHITNTARQFYAMSKKIKSKHALSSSELINVLDMYEDVLDDVHDSSPFPW